MVSKKQIFRYNTKKMIKELENILVEFINTVLGNHNQKMKNYSNKEIRNSIINAFLKNEPKYFIPYLMSQNTYVDDDNKMKFYKLFKHNILNSKINGKITDIKVEKELNGFYNDYLKLNFYDNYHLYPRFSIFYKYDVDKIHLGFMPF